VILYDIPNLHHLVIATVQGHRRRMRIRLVFARLAMTTMQIRRRCPMRTRYTVVDRGSRKMAPPVIAVGQQWRHSHIDIHRDYPENADRSIRNDEQGLRYGTNLIEIP
jgi:hypothetical protein